jgi:hypothetical protein
MDTESLRGVRWLRRDVNHTPTNPYLEQRLKKEKSYTSTPPLCLNGRLEDEVRYITHTDLL